MGINSTRAVSIWMHFSISAIRFCLPHVANVSHFNVHFGIKFSVIQHNILCVPFLHFCSFSFAFSVHRMEVSFSLQCPLFLDNIRKLQFNFVYETFIASYFLSFSHPLKRLAAPSISKTNTKMLIVYFTLSSSHTIPSSMAEESFKNT